MDEINKLPDGSGFFTMSFPLPKNHWIYKEGHNEPPMPLKMSGDNPHREAWVELATKVAKYAIRASTMNGKEMDFDPDAMVQNFVVGMLGYYSTTTNITDGGKSGQ